MAMTNLDMLELELELGYAQVLGLHRKLHRRYRCLQVDDRVVAKLMILTTFDSHCSLISFPDADDVVCQPGSRYDVCGGIEGTE